MILWRFSQLVYAASRACQCVGTCSGGRPCLVAACSRAQVHARRSRSVLVLIQHLWALSPGPVVSQLAVPAPRKASECFEAWFGGVCTGHRRDQRCLGNEMNSHEGRGCAPLSSSAAWSHSEGGVWAAACRTNAHETRPEQWGFRGGSLQQAGSSRALPGRARVSLLHV